MPTYLDTLRRLSCFIVLCDSSSLLRTTTTARVFNQLDMRVFHRSQNFTEIDSNDKKRDPYANHEQKTMLEQIAIWLLVNIIK